MSRLKYVCILLILSLFISGCSIDYKLDMSKETIKEDITVNFALSECNDGQGNCEAYARDLLNSVVTNEGYPNYLLEYFDNGVNGTVKLSYTYSSLDDFIKNNIYKSSYNNVEIDKDTFIVSDSSETYEDELNTNYTVTIIPNKKVKKSNATKVEDNKYIWKFNTSDKNKNIEFSYKGNKTVDKKENIKDSSLNTLYFIIIVIIIGVIVIIIIGYYSKKNQMVNKI